MFNKLSRITAIAVLLSGSLAQPMFSNVQKTVVQVTENVTITDDVDYIITSSTPFGDNAIVNIENTDKAVLILENVKPSAALNLLNHLTIKGEKAKDNGNCQVKLYNRGAIIMPYSSSIRPLTVYSETNFGGESTDNFGMGNSGGYMNTLTSALLNNRIKSFKLKRGYMVTFSTQPSGRGYSRCFIAADKDLEVAELPNVLSGRISSYRIFKWYDAGKKQLANYMDKTAMNALNVQSSYDWAQGNSSFLPDYEWVPNHIYEDWPSSSTIGGTSQSPHCKNNNEPRNSADDHPQDLQTILNNWENMMRTGLRLCSPASWDGSDYWNATGFLAEFMDSIDARGWRCDIIDLHCYWPESNFGNIANWVNKYKRPVWISEWCWGASWNSNGAFANGVTPAQVKTALQSICTKLNGYDYVERYYYWNGERAPSKLYDGGKLTPAGEYYSSMKAPMAYNGKYDFVPTTPRQYNPSNFNVTYTDGTAVITWDDKNGEYNQLMELQRKQKGGQWTTLAVIEQKELADSYTYTDSEATEDMKYRIHIIDVDGKDRYTNDDVEPGDAFVTSDGRTLYAGGNLLMNGDFDMGMQYWTSGKGTALSQPYFEVIPVGGADGGSYLQAYGDVALDGEASLKLIVDVEAGKDYYFRAASRNGGGYQRVSLTTSGAEDKIVALLKNTTEWQKQSSIFNSEQYTKVVIAFYKLGAKAQFDKIELRQLFETSEEAISDGEVKEQPIADALSAYMAEVEQQRADSLAKVASALQATGFTVPDPATIEWYDAAVQPASADFKTATGWETIVGTYKGGDQRTNVVGGKTCWNAWWSNISASQGAKQTMEIRQKMENLPEGIYALQCKATTEHYCLSDQHGYMVYGNDTVNTPVLKADYFDLPTVGNIWQTLTTTPIYVTEGGNITIGFKSSKKGAIDNAWHKFGDANNTGDKREGWWCATDFRLLYHPVYHRQAKAGEWGTICLPYEAVLPEGVTFYRIAGYSTDTTKVYIEEVKEPASGTPYIYYTTVADMRIYEKGEAKTTQLNGDNGLRGFLNPSSKYPLGSYILRDGAWYIVKERLEKIEDYSAIIYRLTGIDVLDSWPGQSMEIDTRTSWEETVGVNAPNIMDDAVTGLYTLDGRKVAESESLPAGIYLKVAAGKVRKIILK